MIVVKGGKVLSHRDGFVPHFMSIFVKDDDVESLPFSVRDKSAAALDVDLARSSSPASSSIADNTSKVER